MRIGLSEPILDCDEYRDSLSATRETVICVGIV